MVLKNFKNISWYKAKAEKDRIENAKTKDKFGYTKPKSKFKTFVEGGGVIGATTKSIGCSYECPLGRFGSLPGQSTLDLGCGYVCPPGKYGVKVGQKNEENACDDCPAGKYGTFDGGTSESSACHKQCNPGRYSLQNSSRQTSDLSIANLKPLIVKTCSDDFHTLSNATSVKNFFIFLCFFTPN